MTLTPEQMAKLPKYARQEIERLASHSPDCLCLLNAHSLCIECDLEEKP